MSRFLLLEFDQDSMDRLNLSKKIISMVLKLSQDSLSKIRDGLQGLTDELPGQKYL